MNNLNPSRTLVAGLMAAALLLPSARSALPATHYVDMNSANATPPYTNWTTAATNIQDAVDAAVAGGEIVVRNGTYATGGWNGSRVEVDKALNLRSVNGPQFTTIAGAGVFRCVYLNSNASLSGFTLTNGSAVYGGGAYGGTLTNCTLANNSARYYNYGGPGYEAAGGGAAYCTLNNCTLSGNSASVINYDDYSTPLAYGGGAAYCTLNNCALSSNSVVAPRPYSIASGGGTAYCTLNACTVSGGSAQARLGASAQCAGAYFSTLDHCTLSGNWGDGASGCALGCALNNCALINNRDVGAKSCTLSNCSLVGNYYGGADSCTLKNCALTDNLGYGAYSCGLTNCTLTGNFNAVSNCTLANCIDYFNSGFNHDSSSTLSYCCTTPMPTHGVGNISSDPQLASAFRLSALSPCIGKGYYPAVSGVDIDGESWANPPSMGCDEYHAGAVSGPVCVAIGASYTSVAVGYQVSFTAWIEGRADLNVWEFGDGSLEINEPHTTHAWFAPGDYVVSLWAFNESYPGGTNATVTVHVVTGLHYVAGGSTNPAAPYTSWSTAATNIQDAINAAAEAGGQVLVTNGTYPPITASYNPVGVRSINGTLLTIIDGGKANRCATLGQYGSLSGFTLTNGVSTYGGGAYGGTLSNCALCGNLAPDYGGGGGGGAYNCTLYNCVLSDNSGHYGGGAYGGTLHNCILTGNSASFGGGALYSTLNNCRLSGNSAGGDGGGVWGGTLINCTLTGNSAFAGGGAFQSVLSNCTLSGNSAVYGGGAEYCTLNNCIVYFNTAGQYYEDNYFQGTLNYCCTTPDPGGLGNITNAPLFVDTNGWANLRLQSNSPCINAGNNAYAPAGPDLDGNPRIAGGTVDIGAYEFQSPASRISYAWLEQFNLPTNPWTDTADPDGDGLNNWQEWICGTDPTNALSVLRLLSPAPGVSGVQVSWQSVNTRTYLLERSANPGAQASFLPVATNIPGQTGTTTSTDTNAVVAGPWFYRVGVSAP
jgi:hypothetical protein